MEIFEAGQVIAKREVWGDRVWLEHPVRVDSDDGDVPGGALAVVLHDASPFTFDDLDPDGTRHWKGVEALSARLAEGRFDVPILLRVLDTAAELSDLLDRDDRWWAPWDDWRPAERG